MRKSPVLIMVVLVLTSCASTSLTTGSPTLVNDKYSTSKRPVNISVIADERVFAVMAFINAVGYDIERSYKPMNNVRKILRERLGVNLKSKTQTLEKWRKFYSENSLPETSYFYLALTLSDSYPFEQTNPLKPAEISFFKNKFDNFHEMINEFYENANLKEIWNELKPIYTKEIEKYKKSKMEKQISDVWRYLKVERPDNFDFLIYPNLIVQNDLGMCFQRDNSFITMESSGAISYGLNIHEYLHTYVNNLVQENIEPYLDKFQKYFDARTDGQFAIGYDELNKYVSECLVRAIDSKINGRKIETLDAEEKWGFNLVKPFYLKLGGFEKSDQSFNSFISELLRNVDSI